MKLALIADTHANLPALKAVLTAVKKQNVDSILDAGDATGYGAFPDNVVSRLPKKHIISVIGNYDQKVLSVKQNKAKWLKKKPAEKVFAFAWTYDHLSAKNRAYLSSLPESRLLKYGNRHVLLIHGSGGDTRLSPPKRFGAAARKSKAAVVVFGHSHQQSAHTSGKVLYVNPGSVGRPDDGDPRAGYAVLTLHRNRVSIRHYRVDYDIKQAVAEIRRQKLPGQFAAMIEQGRNFDFIQSDARLDSVLALARHCEYEEEHSRQVTKLARRLFDELQALHGFGPRERFYLQCAAILHDIGFIHGLAKHHKTALKIILTSPRLKLDKLERQIIGSIARYHRKALPALEHRHYAALKPPLRKTVSILAGLLRLADGLDTSHDHLIDSLSCEITRKTIVITARARDSRREPQDRIIRKGILLQQATDRKITVRWVESGRNN